ncbi:MAG TPA: hypothetical protein VEX40_13725 [Mycobacterium sp.]|nr:hypothetical protein [Mycobacterium sp.]
MLQEGGGGMSGMGAIAMGAVPVAGGFLRLPLFIVHVVAVLVAAGFALRGIRSTLRRPRRGTH